MRRQRAKGKRQKVRIFSYVLLLVAVLAAVLPVYWMVTISLKAEVDQFAVPPIWFAFKPTWEHYYDTFFVRPFGKYLLTSTIVTVASTALALLVGTLAAYSLARFRLPRNLPEHLSLWIISTRMFPPIVTIIPLFLMMRDLRLLNTIPALIIIYTGFNLPFVVWMMRGFFEELPRDLEEAAMVDGDSRLGALVRVMLPLTAPGLAATAIFCLIICWNEFLFALILTQTEASITLPVGMAGRVTQYEIQWGAMSAAGVVAMIPILVVAMAVQRYLVRGLSLGAVKG